MKEKFKKVLPLVPIIVVIIITLVYSAVVKSKQKGSVDVSVGGDGTKIEVSTEEPVTEDPDSYYIDSRGNKYDKSNTTEATTEDLYVPDDEDETGNTVIWTDGSDGNNTTEATTEEPVQQSAGTFNADNYMDVISGLLTGNTNYLDTDTCTESFISSYSSVATTGVMGDSFGDCDFNSGVVTYNLQSEDNSKTYVVHFTVENGRLNTWTIE